MTTWGQRVLFIWFFVFPVEITLGSAEPDAENVIVRDQYEILRQLALAGDAKYRYGLFTFADEHRSEIPDLYEDAFQFLIQSAREGYVESEYLLGYMTLTGDSKELSVEEGVNLLQSASSKGHGRARYWLAEYYMSRWYGRAFSSATGVPSGPKYSDDDFCLAKKLFESLILEEKDEPDLVLAGKLRLGTLLLAHSMDDDKGWELLFELASAGYQPARERLKKMRGMLARGAEKGFDDAERHLTRLEKFLEEQK